MAMGANFSLKADSHLVCMQSEQGYKTQAINIQNQPRKGTIYRLEVEWSTFIGQWMANIRIKGKGKGEGHFI